MTAGQLGSRCLFLFVPCECLAESINGTASLPHLPSQVLDFVLCRPICRRSISWNNEVKMGSVSTNEAQYSCADREAA